MLTDGDGWYAGISAAARAGKQQLAAGRPRHSRLHGRTGSIRQHMSAYVSVRQHTDLDTLVFMAAQVAPFIKALSRFYQGSIKALSRYSQCLKRAYPQVLLVP